jgi:pyruvate/2-oxoacid:ferredoxin oxidoreductase beta subunit
MTVDHYLVSVYAGSYPSAATAVYENRYMKAAPHLFGSLQDIASGMHMTLRIVAAGTDGSVSRYADTRFQMP